jgi:hypothetical protein
LIEGNELVREVILVRLILVLLIAAFTGCIKKKSQVQQSQNFSGGCWKVEVVSGPSEQRLEVVTDKPYEDLWTATMYCRTANLGARKGRKPCVTKVIPASGSTEECQNAFRGTVFPPKTTESNSAAQEDVTQNLVSFRPQIPSNGNELEIFNIPESSKMEQEGLCHEFTWSNGGTVLKARGPGLKELEDAKASRCPDCVLSEMKLYPSSTCTCKVSPGEQMPWSGC